MTYGTTTWHLENKEFCTVKACLDNCNAASVFFDNRYYKYESWFSDPSNKEVEKFELQKLYSEIRDLIEAYKEHNQSVIATIDQIENIERKFNSSTIPREYYVIYYKQSKTCLIDSFGMLIQLSPKIEMKISIFEESKEKLEEVNTPEEIINIYFCKQKLQEMKRELDLQIFSCSNLQKENRKLNEKIGLIVVKFDDIDMERFKIKEILLNDQQC